jgi:hypothetical protein
MEGAFSLTHAERPAQLTAPITIIPIAAARWRVAIAGGQERRSGSDLRLFYSAGAAMRLVSLLALATVLAALAACAPYQDVPGDLCNDRTRNYTPDYAYECNAK